MDFNVRIQKAHGYNSDFTLQLTFKNYYLLNFSVVSKNICNYLKKLLEYSSLFQLHTYLYGEKCSSHTSTNGINNNGLNTEAGKRIQLPSIN